MAELKWVPLKYKRVQHVVAEINALILKAKTDKQFRSSLTVEYRDSMADRAAALTRWAHLAKQDERPEYVLIAKQVTRFRQLRNSCENEASKGQNWSPDDAPPSPVTVGGSPVVPPPLPPPPPTTASGSPSTPNTASTNSPSPRRKERRASVSASKKRQGSNIAMIKNRLRGASYHLGKMDFARLFRYYDRDNSGQIDRKEFISLVRRDGKIPPAKLSDLKLEKMFDTKLDLDGTGDVSHAEFVEWILEDPHHDGGGGQDQPPEYEDQGPPLDTFTRLYMSKPTYTQELKKSSPRSRRKSLNEPESGGDFRSILRSDFNNDTARQWRQDYHTRVDTKQAEYPPLYAWEEEKARAMGGGGDIGRKFASPVTASAQKAQDSHFMLNVEKLRIKSKLPSFHEQNNIAFGSRIPPKLPSPGEVKRRKAAERAAQKQAEREARPAWRNICNFTVVMNDDEAALYQRLRLSIPIEKDSFQAAAAKDAAQTATRRLSMFDYANQTNEMWQNGQTVHGAPGSESAGVAPTRPPVPVVLPKDKAAKPAQETPIDPYGALYSGHNMPGYDRMKSAAIAAGVASQNAARRGSTVTLVSPTHQTTSLMYRRPSSLGRELAEANRLHNHSTLPIAQ